MKKFPALFVVLSTLVPLKCAFAQAPDTRSYIQVITSAKTLEKWAKDIEAASEYRIAVKKATTDEQRAQAYLGVGRNSRIRYGEPDPATDGKEKLTAFQSVLDLAGAPASAKVESHLGKAETHAALAQYDAALESLKQVSLIAEATAGQKRQAQLWSGQILVEAKRYDEARTQLVELLGATDVSISEKLTAHRTIARSYLGQKNLDSALAEITKINALPGLTDINRADIHLANGDMLAQAEQYGAARDEYGKVAVLADAPVDRNVSSHVKVGETFYKEKNYTKAREVWTQVLDMRGGATHAKMLWQAIGVAYAEDKQYDKAREAYAKWLAVPGLDLNGKVDAWRHIASAYVQEKNYPAARDAISNIDKGSFSTTMDGAALFLRKKYDEAEIYLAEGEAGLAVVNYLSMLDHIKNSTVNLAGIKPQDYYDAPKLIKQAADNLAKEPATRANAFTLYEALEKFHPYDLQKAEALLGMGDVLVAQGKPDEARAKYEKALELRKNFKEGKLAQQKLDALAAPKPATQ